MLGMAVAGRGEDFNDVLRRANPSLALARKTIGILEKQRDELGRTVDATTEITAALAENPKDLAALVRHAGRVSTQTASQRGALGEGVRRLPALLAAATPALQRLDQVIESGKPLVDQLGKAAPDINRVAVDVPRLSKAAAPTLRKLAPVLRRGAAAARKSAPVTKVMAEYAHNSLPSARRAGSLFPSLEQQRLQRRPARILLQRRGRRRPLRRQRPHPPGPRRSHGLRHLRHDARPGAAGRGAAAAAKTAQEAGPHRSGEGEGRRARSRTQRHCPIRQAARTTPGAAAPAPAPAPRSGRLPDAISGLLDYLLR